MSAFTGNIKKSKLSSFQNPAVLVKPGEQIISIDTSKIIYNKQDRSQDNPGFSDESLDELGDSIVANGQAQPCIVRPHPDKAGYFIMVAGERRGRAAERKKVQLKVVVRDITDDQHRLIQRAENVQRVALTQLEIASALRADKDRLGTLEAVAKEWNKGVNWVFERIKFGDIISAGGVAEQAVSEGLTADVSAVIDLAKLEKQDPKAAANVLAQVKDNPSANVRAVVRDKLNEVKTSQNSPRQKAGKSTGEEVAPESVPSNSGVKQAKSTRAKGKNDDEAQKRVQQALSQAEDLRQQLVNLVESLKGDENLSSTALDSQEIIAPLDDLCANLRKKISTK